MAPNPTINNQIFTPSFTLAPTTTPRPADNTTLSQLFSPLITKFLRRRLLSRGGGVEGVGNMEEGVQGTGDME